MTPIDAIALAATTAAISGWRLYLCVLTTGIAIKCGYIHPPENLKMLNVLADTWVIMIAAVGLIAETLADKIAWIDSAWDSVHTAVRPIGGALLALAIVDASNPWWQVVSFLLGGGVAFASHAAKQSTRAVVNLSPEPVSNFVVSSGEDVVTGGLLALTLAYPLYGALAALAVALLVTMGFVFIKRQLRRFWQDEKRDGSA